MAAPLSQDLRRRLVQAVDKGQFSPRGSAAFRRKRVCGDQVGPAGARNRQHGTGPDRRLSQAVAGRTRGSVARADRNKRSHHPGRDPGGVGGARYRRGLLDHDLVDTAPARVVTQKNALRAAEQNRPDVVIGRRLWRSWQPFMDPERFVFIDETGASTNMIRRYGWAEPSRTGQTSSLAADFGGPGSPSWTRNASCSSTRPVPART